MQYLHTMVRVTDLDRALDFYCTKLGLIEVSRREDEKGKYTNVFLRAPGDEMDMASKKALASSDERASGGGPLLELTYNWPARPGDKEEYTVGRNFGHLAYAVDDIYAYCESLQKAGITINRPPKDGRMAFIRSPEGISIELLQIGEAKAVQEPWKSMPNIGTW